MGTVLSFIGGCIFLLFMAYCIWFLIANWT